MKKMIIAISLGDPGGIGPEITLKAVKQFKRENPSVQCVLIGHQNSLKHSLPKSYNSSFFTPFNVDLSRKQIFSLKKGVWFFELPLKKTFDKGVISKINGSIALDSIQVAIQLCMNKQADSMVTAPVSKAGIRKVSKQFKGHTELLAKESGAKNVSMMFVSDKVKIVLATTHLPLKMVSKSITKQLIYKKICFTQKVLKQMFGMKKIKLAISALNPHGNEFGTEEDLEIKPAIQQAKKKRIPVYGPIPGDEIFRELIEGKWDAIISMYHDQALAPFKAFYFDSGVNLTVGLPFIRTSPDHGTAYDIAYKRKANFKPMLSALNLAKKLNGKVVC